jgi:hypothetical protein
VIEIKDVVVGMRVRAGLELPRDVLVYAAPFQVDGRWRVPCEYRTGTREDLPLAVLHHAPKRPSARYGREQLPNEARATLYKVVAEFNEVVPESSRVGSVELEDKIRKHGVRR